MAGSVAVTLPSNGDPVWGELVIAEPVDNVSGFDAVVDFVQNFINDGAVTGITLSTSIALLSASCIF